MAFRGFTGIRTYEFTLQRDLRELDRYLKGLDERISQLLGDESLGQSAGGTGVPGGNPGGAGGLLLEHAAKHATKVSAATGFDPLDVFYMKWRMRQVIEPDLDVATNVPLTVKSSSASQTADMVNVHDVVGTTPPAFVVASDGNVTINSTATAGLTVSGPDGGVNDPQVVIENSTSGSLGIGVDITGDVDFVSDGDAVKYAFGDSGGCIWEVENVNGAADILLDGWTDAAFSLVYRGEYKWRFRNDQVGSGENHAMILAAGQVTPVILSCMPSGLVGINTDDPQAALDVEKTTEQLRLSYDVNNYTSFTTGVTGALAITPITNAKITASVAHGLTIEGPPGFGNDPQLLLKTSSTGTAGFSVNTAGELHTTASGDLWKISLEDSGAHVVEIENATSALDLILDSHQDSALGFQHIGVWKWRFRNDETGSGEDDAMLLTAGQSTPVVFSCMPSGLVGVNTNDPQAALDIEKTTEQLRLSYDASNYMTATVASDGGTTFDSVGTDPEFFFTDQVNLTSPVFTGGDEALLRIPDIPTAVVPMGPTNTWSAIKIGTLSDVSGPAGVLIDAILIEDQTQFGASPSATTGNLRFGRDDFSGGSGGGWNSGHIQLGSFHIWDSHDEPGLSGKNGTPISAIDGGAIPIVELVDQNEDGSLVQFMGSQDWEASYELLGQYLFYGISAAGGGLSPARITAACELHFQGTGVGTDYVGFKPPVAADIASSFVWTLPAADGNAGEFLFTDGAGALSWSEPSMAYAVQLDEAAASLTYIGEAQPGTATAAASWRIKRLDESGDPEIIVLWADGDSNFDNVWDNRAALSYS